MPLKTAMPSATRISAPAPLAQHQRHHAEDEGERRHQDRPQPQPARLDGRLERGLALRPRSCLANSTIRMAFLAARPISTTRPICVKMLLSSSDQPDAGDRREQAHRHDQDDRQRQRPALVLGRQHQEHEHDGQREDELGQHVLAGQDLLVASARSTRSPSSTGSCSRRRAASMIAIACPELTPGAVLPLISADGYRL